TFPLKYGDKNALSSADALILSQAVAERFFGTGNPVGRHVTLKQNNGRLLSFTVAGVAEPFPESASLRFNMLARYDRQLEAGVERLDDWQRFTGATFIQLRDGADLASIAG